MTSPASRSQKPLSAGWQDISTAPRDGTPGDVWCVPPADCDFKPQEGGIRLTDVSWHTPTEGWPHEGWARVTDSGYLDLIDSPPTAPDGLPRWVPTHWCPRPAPPAENSLSGAQQSELSRLAQDEPVSSPPSTGGEGEDWDRIPRAKRFGRRLNESAVKHLAPGTLLRFYSEDPWFDPSPSSPANGDIVIFTGAVSNTFPKVGPHLEVRTLGGRVYPGGGWVYQIFQFVADPSPEMGEISREEIAREIDAEAFSKNPWDATEALAMSKRRVAALDKADAKLKENGLSREELGGLARSLPSGDAQERCPVPPLSDGDVPPAWEAMAQKAADSLSAHLNAPDVAARLDQAIAEGFACGSAGAASTEGGR